MLNLAVLQVRDDKTPEDASGPQYIADLFHLQTRKAASATKKLTSIALASQAVHNSRDKVLETDGLARQDADDSGASQTGSDVDN